MALAKVLLEKGKLCLYSNYSQADKCKAVISGKWDPRKKRWEYPPEAIVDIEDVFGEGNVKYDNEALRYKEGLLGRLQLIEKIKKGEVPPPKYLSKFLMTHQKAAAHIADIMPRYALFLDTGTGKTITSLEIIKQSDIGKWLVLCPKAIIKTAWFEDQESFYPYIRLLPIGRNTKKGELEYLRDKWGLPAYPRETKDQLMHRLQEEAEVLVINYESFVPDVKQLKGLGIKGVIIDESAKLRNAGTKRTRLVTDFSHEMERLYILSGKPAPRSEIDYYSQMKLVTPAALGQSKSRFLNTYFYPSGYGGYEWKPYPETPSRIAERIRPWSIFIKLEDCVDIKKPVLQRRLIELPKEAKKGYKQMEKELFLQLDDADVSAASKVASIMKLRQLTGGFVFDEAGNDHPFHDAKMKELMEVLEEIGNTQVLIWVQFKPEARMITEALEKEGYDVVTAYSETQDIDKSIQDFKEGRVQYMVANPASLMYGATFVKHCHHAVYYSLSYDYEQYYQSYHRIYRKGQNERCSFTFLLAENTIDELIYNVVINEKSARSVKVEDLNRYIGRG